MYKFLRNISFRRRAYKPLVKSSGVFEPVLPHETAEAEEKETAPKWGEVGSKDTDFDMESRYWG
jgi:hypothetical protein